MKQKAKIFKVIIDNFESHVHSEIQFSDFSVIIGETHSGKSAILRAMKWCLFNEVADTNFINQNADYAEVSVYFDNGKVVTRKKGKNINSYKIGNTVLEAFGAGPVDLVMEYHRMRVANLFGYPENLNFSNQLAPPFFVAESASKKAAMIGGMANTESVDLAITDLLKDVRVAKALKKSLKATKKETEEKLQEFSTLPEMQLDYERCLRISGEISASQTALRNLVASQASLKTAVDKISMASTAIEREPEIMLAESILETMNNSFNRLQALIKTKNDLQFVVSKFRIASAVLQKIHIADVDTAAALVDGVILNLSKVRSVKQKSAAIKDFETRLEACRRLLRTSEDIKTAEILLFEISEKFHTRRLLGDAATRLRAEVLRVSKGNLVLQKLESDLASRIADVDTYIRANPVCPVCGNIIDEKVILGGI